MDNRSIELRDYLTERSEALRKAQFSNIPSADVLENSLADLRPKERHPGIRHPAADVSGEAEQLRELANELRIAGLLLQALETFRRAARLRPKDAWLLFEFARCMQSFAGSQRDGTLERKAVALMRLSEKRAGNDGVLLARLGEAYFQIGEWRRAGIVFSRAIDSVGESFRTLRGMAEIALREGKIAHVIHNFAAANRMAETPALRRWTQAEVDYFSRLNEDDEYMELEFSRVNMLDTLQSVGSSALKIAFLSFPLIAVGVLFEDSLVANIGWAISGIALFIWVGIMFLRRLLSPRIPFDLVKGD
jgi:tetratricopeptide (TPR) repeat protein